MSCGCNQTPCSCSANGSPSVMPVIPCNQSPCCCGSCDNLPAIGTLCDLDRRCNIWVEGPVDANGAGGICLLDTIEECQLVISLQRSQKAKDDLLKVTSNEYLRNLAKTIPLLPTVEEGDALQKEINGSSGPAGQVSNPNAIPFYAIFRGQPPFAQ